MKYFLFKRQEFFIVFILIIIGAFFRFYNLNWDQGHFFHPDERNIAAAVSRINFFNQLNPGFFAYGGFSIYLYRAALEVLAVLTNSNSWLFDWAKIDFVGRFFSAFFSAITIVPLFFLAKKIFGKQIALLSVLFYIFSISSIQTAHFAVTESFITLCAVLIALLSINLFENPNLKNYLRIGVVLGIATAAKTTALSLLIFPLTASLFIFTENKKFLKRKALLSLTLIMMGLITFTIFSPYTFLDWKNFTASMHYESGVATGSLPVVYTLQFDKTLPYLFQIKNFFWQLGPLTIFSVAGSILLFMELIKTRDRKIFILLSFPTIYFLYVGSWHTKFIRYMMPILPFLIIFASFALYQIKLKTKIFGNVLIIGVLFVTVLWTLAFFSIYTREQTRIAASKWVYQNIEPNSKILIEHWDDGLPLPIPPFSPNQYNIEPMAIYEPDNETKLNYYADILADADYIIINSRRLYGTLINLPEKYPLTSKYYKMLFAQKLGYEKIAEFSSYPKIFGLEINDDSSEETFQVYDHPKVLIFKKMNIFRKKK